MKKIILIIFINIVLLVGIIYSVDYFSAKYEFMNYWKDTEQNNSVSVQTPSKPEFYYSNRIVSFEKVWRDFFISPYRVSAKKDYQKPAIMVFGCSFAQGAMRENFEYLLSQKTKRMVYNRGFTGLGIANMYYQVSNPKFYKLLHPKIKPQYAVYIFLGRRFLERYFYAHQLAKENNDKNFDLIKLYFEKSRDELKKRFPDIKFVIMKYPSKEIGSKAHEEIYNSLRWSELENQGFKVIDLKNYVKEDLTSQEYLFKDNHPNEKAWQVITDKFAADINKGRI